jgi:hypothetical protein
MKKSTWLLLLFLTYGITICAQIESKLWNYSQMKEHQENGKWIEKPYAEKLSTLQVPDSIIRSIPTSDLLDVCLSYPLNGDMLLFNNINAGFQHVISNFNGWKEYLKRKDAIIVNCKKFDQDLNVENIEQFAKDQNKDIFRNSIFFIEKMISQTDLVNNCTIDEKK